MVKVKAKDVKAGKADQRRHKFFNCALSGGKQRSPAQFFFAFFFFLFFVAPLANPIVACETGRLYNYEVVLNTLLNKRKLPKELQHLEKISDVFTVKFSANTTQKGDDSPWVCPGGCCIT